MKTIGILLRKDNNKYSFPAVFFKILKDVNIIGILPNNINCLDKIDGVILPGGNIEEDSTFNFIKYLYNINKPTLGICLGMQEMSKVLGGKIVKMESNNHLSNMKYTHEININEKSKLYNILNKNKILVNSRHSFKVLIDKKYISAISNDNIIEAIEDKTKKFFIGVQFHIEDLPNDINSKLIFEYFIKSFNN